MQLSYGVMLPALCGFSFGILWIISRFNIYQRLWDKSKEIDPHGVLLPSAATLIFPFMFAKTSLLVSEFKMLNNQTAAIAIFGTILGATVTQIGNLMSKRIDHANSLKIKRLSVAVEVEKQHIIDPIISFLDKDIKLIQKGYSQSLSNEEMLAIDKEHIFDLSSIEARVQTLNDEKLIQKFKKFSTMRLVPKPEESNNEKYERLLKATELEKEILSLLFERLRQLEV